MNEDYISQIIKAHPHLSVSVLAGMYDGVAATCEANHQAGEPLPDHRTDRSWQDRAWEAAWIADELRKRQ